MKVSRPIAVYDDETFQQSAPFRCKEKLSSFYCYHDGDYYCYQYYHYHYYSIVIIIIIIIIIIIVIFVIAIIIIVIISLLLNSL